MPQKCSYMAQKWGVSYRNWRPSFSRRWVPCTDPAMNKVYRRLAAPIRYFWFQG